MFRYDPQRAYYERMNQTQKAGIARRQNSMFSDSIGGCSSNYQKEPDMRSDCRSNYDNKKNNEKNQ